MSPDGELVSAEALASLGMLLVHSGRLSQRTAVPCLHLCNNAGQLRRTNLARLRMLMCLQCSKLVQIAWASSCPEAAPTDDPAVSLVLQQRT